MIFKALDLSFTELEKTPSPKEELMAISERHSYKVGMLILQQRQHVKVILLRVSGWVK